MADLSRDQQDAVALIHKWYITAPISYLCESCEGVTRSHTHGRARTHPVLCVGGLAGTGKTYLASALERALGVGPTFAAPTHKAAAVLRGKIGGEVRTYHSMIYKPSEVFRCRKTRISVDRNPEHECEDKDDCVCPDRFYTCGAGHDDPCVLDREPVFTRRTVLDGEHRLIVVDEASMLTDEQVEDVRAFGVPVLLIGDHGQLPPVKAQMNRWMAAPDAVLSVNHRQADESGIAALAYRVRAGERPRAGRYGQVAVLDAKTHPDAVEALLSRFQPGENRALIVWRNQTRVAVNAMMRGHDGPPRDGDRVVCLRGCEMPVDQHGDPVYVHNGALGTVVECTTRPGVRTATMVVQLDDGEAVFTHAALAQFGQPDALAWNDPERPRGNGWHSWDYGYAITAHKAQGSEWSEVIVIDENPMDYGRWMYTAVTRASERLVIVKW